MNQIVVKGIHDTDKGSCRLLLVVIQLVRIVGRIVVGKKWLGLDVVGKSVPDGVLQLTLREYKAEAIKLMNIIQSRVTLTEE
nr:hypothetical protein [Tanacetum cinerariifolium]